MNEFFGPTNRRFTSGTGSDDSDHEHFSTCFDIPAPGPVHEPVEFGITSGDHDPPAVPPVVSVDVDKTSDATILQMLQFYDASDIHEAIFKKPKPSPESICLRIEQLLYTASEAVDALESTQKARPRRKKPALAPFERYLMLYWKTRFPELPFEQVVQDWRFMFWGGHKIEDLADTYKDVCDMDVHGETRIIEELANECAADESEIVGQGFQTEEMKRAALTNEDFEWWKAWIGESMASREVPAEAPTADVRHVDINQLEAEFEFLSQNEMWDSQCLAVIEGENARWNVQQKVTLIGEGDRNAVDMDLLDAASFERTSGELLAVLELKSDLCFYMENIGEASFYVNGLEIPPGKATYLNNFAFLEFANIGMIFRINSFRWAELLEAVAKAEGMARKAENKEEEEEMDANDLIGPGTSDDDDDNDIDDPVLSSD